MELDLNREIHWIENDVNWFKMKFKLIYLGIVEKADVLMER